MNQDESWQQLRNEVFDLCEKVIHGDLLEADKDRLESLVIEDKRARKLYVECMHQHAALHWQRSAEAEIFSLSSELKDATARESDADAETLGERSSVNERKVVVGLWTWGKVAAAVAMLLAAGILGWGGAVKEGAPVVVATLVKTANCSWQGGALPTEEGAVLEAGRLRLQQGLARLKFASGVELTLEAPVDIELLSPMLCRLHSGTVVAKVPEQAQGFMIETQSATLVDHGTEFGVHVGQQGGATNVVVFDGIVDVEQRNTGEVQRLTTGNGSKVSSQSFVITEVVSPELVESRAVVASVDSSGSEWVTITTQDGGGEDAYVQATESDIHTSETLLLVKNSEVFDKGLGYSRKVYLRFDLQSLAKGRDLLEASLQLTIKKSHFGYASFVPDAEFVVYAVSDDDWSRESITWQTAPANNHTGGEADLSQSVELGTFVIPQGVYSGQVGLEGDALLKFLQQESKGDGMVTLLVVRRTGEIRKGSGLVHAFVSKRHPGGAAPTLKVKLAR
ncbi:MAG: DNRLRE domain-containing protein [Verrucomicrobiales bacterium]|nr:DNRLRE domain-containing protein [Verrucomicrobiales bacterium]